jgi:hypothetical protein
MVKQKSKQRPKVADRNADIAQANIALKLAYLKTQLEAAEKDAPANAAVLAFLPKSRSQFNRWESAGSPSELALPFFTSNAPQTLRRDMGTAKTVDLAVAQVPRLRAAANKQSDPYRSKLEKISNLKRELRALKTMKEIAERELVKYHVRVEALLGEVQILRAADVSKSREFERVLSEKQAQLDLMSPNRSTQSGTKVVSIKKI